MQKSGAAMPRVLLVQRCVNDQASASCISSATLTLSHDCLHSPTAFTAPVQACDHTCE